MMYQRKEENKLITNVNYNSWKNLVDQAWKYDLFATFEYDVPQKDYLAEKGMSFLLKAVQRSVYSNQYIKRNDCFKGFSFAERHVKSKDKKRSFHFHNMINLGSVELTDEFKQKIENEFHRKALKLIYKNKQIAIAPTAIHLEWNIYNQDGLADYCLKDFGKSNKEGSKISMIDLGGANKYSYQSEIKLMELHSKYHSALK